MPTETSRRHRPWRRMLATAVVFGVMAGVLSGCYVYPAAPAYRPDGYYQPAPHYYYGGGYYYR